MDLLSHDPPLLASLTGFVSYSCSDSTVHQDCPPPTITHRFARLPHSCPLGVPAALWLHSDVQATGPATFSLSSLVRFCLNSVVCHCSYCLRNVFNCRVSLLLHSSLARSQPLLEPDFSQPYVSTVLGSTSGETWGCVHGFMVSALRCSSVPSFPTSPPWCVSFPISGHRLTVSSLLSIHLLFLLSLFLALDFASLFTANIKAIRLNARLLLPSQINSYAWKLGSSQGLTPPLLSPVSSVSPFVDAFLLAHRAPCHHMFKEYLPWPRLLAALPASSASLPHGGIVLSAFLFLVCSRAGAAILP